MHLSPSNNLLATNSIYEFKIDGETVLSRKVLFHEMLLAGRRFIGWVVTLPDTHKSRKLNQVLSYKYR